MFAITLLNLILLLLLFPANVYFNNFAITDMIFHIFINRTQKTNLSVNSTAS